MKCPFVIKVCTKCHRILVANEMNFNKKKGDKWGLYSICKQCRRQYRENNPEYFKQWRENNPEYYKQYFKDKPHVAFNNNIKHRHGVNSNITKEQYYEILEYFGYKCSYCGCELNENNLSLDHIIPLSKGGAVDPWCIVPCCGSCNSSKKDKNYLLWLNEKEMFDIEKLEKIYAWIEFAFDKYNDN